MRKAKVAAIVCGMIASCLFGGFAVVDAATITLDDSSAPEVVSLTIEIPTEDIPAAAATVTSIESTAAAKSSEKATTEPVMTEITAETTVETVSSTEQTKEPLKYIPVVKPDSYAAPPVRTTAETETTAAKKVQTTTTTKAAPKETAPLSTTAPKIKEEVVTNPPMPEQPAEVVPPQTQVETVAPAPMTEQPTEAPTEPAIEAPAENVAPSVTQISESDYILLCNAVAHEAGANNISETEKAKVVEVIMNRVASPNYPNTIYEVLTQKYQFSGSSSYVNLGTYSSKVSDKVKAAVDLYFQDPSAFNDGYLSFTGDGRQNYFR